FQRKKKKILNEKTKMLDVVIVGGGASGLACCHRLLKHDPTLNIKILEAKDRLGGRIFAKDLKVADGTESYDLGGQWIGRSQIHAIRLLKEFDLSLYDQNYDGSTVNILDKGTTFYTSSPLSLAFQSVYFAYDMIQGMKKIDEYSQEISIEEPLSHPRAKEWDNLPMSHAKQYLFKHQWSRKLLDIAFITMFGFDLNQASFLYVLLYAKCAGGMTVLIDDRFPGNAQESKVKGGMFKLIEKLKGAVGEEKILLNRRVTSIHNHVIDDQNGFCSIRTENTEEFQCKYVVMAVPPHLISNIKMTPELPTEHKRLLQFSNVGCLMKCIATYKRKFWQENGLSGMSLHWPYYAEERSIEHPVSITYDATSCNGKPALVGFIGGSLIQKMRHLTEDKIKRAIINSFVLFFGDEAKEYIDIAFQDWSKVEDNGGCPVTFTTPGAVSKYGDVCLRQPHLRTHFAGTETATLWRGFVSGAVQSGERAADEIIRRLDTSYVPKDIEVALRKYDGEDMEYIS
uniref:Amine oxidase n=2 Tax=Clytia hemisphaerica TaxID=252671 RepID=A0A7M5X197_9CNID